MKAGTGYSSKTSHPISATYLDDARIDVRFAKKIKKCFFIYDHVSFEYMCACYMCKAFGLKLKYRSYPF